MRRTFERDHLSEDTFYYSPSSPLPPQQCHSQADRKEQMQFLVQLRIYRVAGTTTNTNIVIAVTLAYILIHLQYTIIMHFSEGGYPVVEM